MIFLSVVLVLLSLFYLSAGIGFAMIYMASGDNSTRQKSNFYILVSTAGLVVGSAWFGSLFF